MQESQIIVRVGRDLKRKLREMAAKEDRSLSNFVRKVLQQEVKKVEQR
ncbi:MAG: ribbon-helix-helix protein, CopG family [Planctomycetota bacterium]